jgi:hypothetical protein
MLHPMTPGGFYMSIALFHLTSRNSLVVSAAAMFLSVAPVFGQANAPTPVQGYTLGVFATGVVGAGFDRGLPDLPCKMAAKRPSGTFTALPWNSGMAQSFTDFHFVLASHFIYFIRQLPLLIRPSMERSRHYHRAGPPPIDSRSASISEGSWSVAALRFSRRWSTEDVPGISRMLGER